MHSARRCNTLLGHLAALPASGDSTIPSWATFPTRADPKQTVHRRNVEAEEAAIACLDLFMNTWNARDEAAHQHSFNLPSVRIAGHPPKVRMITEESYKKAFLGPSNVFTALEKADGWHHSSWDRRTVIWSEPDKVHFDCCFSRYRADGSVIGVYESTYIVTRDRDGHWGVAMRSSSAA